MDRAGGFAMLENQLGRKHQHSILIIATLDVGGNQRLNFGKSPLNSMKL